jgi:hypothetical protein
MWVPVGWGYHAPESLASAIFLFMLAAGPLRTLFSVAQLSAHVSSAPRLVALYSLIEATGTCLANTPDRSTMRLSFVDLVRLHFRRRIRRRTVHQVY